MSLLQRMFPDPEVPFKCLEKALQALMQNDAYDKSSSLMQTAITSFVLERMLGNAFGEIGNELASWAG